MQLHTLSFTNLCWTYSISVPLTTHSTKILKEPNFRSNAPFLTVQSAKLLPDLVYEGYQRKRENELSRFLRTDAAIKNIDNKTHSQKYKKLWPRAVLEALDVAIRENQWRYALKIFGLLRKQLWYEPRWKTYTKLLMMLGRCKQTWEARLLFRSMKSEGLQPTVEVYTALVSAYGESGQFDKAFSTVDEMKTVSDCRPDVYTYSVLIQCCIKHYRFDLIGRILAEMSYLGVECNTITFNIIIEGYGKAEMFEKMENSLTDMVESGSSIPDTSTLNSVIGAYGNSGQIEKMEKWYSEFQLMGIHPDIQTFNILMTSYGKAGMHKKIKSILKFMEERFFTPTIVTYNIIIEAFGRVGDIEKMDEYFETMKHQGVKPNAITYCSLVRAYSKAGLMTKVDSILRQVVNSDVVLDTPFFNCIISAYGLAGDIETMTELFLAMEERKCKPNNITFETLIRAFKAQGMTEVAQQFENKILAAKENSGRRRYYVYSSRRMIEA